MIDVGFEEIEDLCRSDRCDVRVVFNSAIEVGDEGESAITHAEFRC